MSPSDLGILFSGLYVAVIALLLDPSVTRVPLEYNGHLEFVPVFLQYTVSLVANLFCLQPYSVAMRCSWWIC